MSIYIYMYIILSIYLYTNIKLHISNYDDKSIYMKYITYNLNCVDTIGVKGSRGVKSISRVHPTIRGSRFVSVFQCDKRSFPYLR